MTAPEYKKAKFPVLSADITDKDILFEVIIYSGVGIFYLEFFQHASTLMNYKCWMKYQIPKVKIFYHRELKGMKTEVHREALKEKFSND